MSSALLKRSTELLHEDLINSDKKSNAPQRQSANKSDRILKLKSNKNIKERKQTVHDLKQTLDGNKLCNENIKKLLELSENSLQIVAAEKIVKRAHKGRYAEDTVSKVQQQHQESIFTEQDFEAFGKEYLG